MSRVYPWHFVARWPYYFFFPRQRNRKKMPLFPLEHRFLDTPRSECVRIVVAGDFMITQGDRVPEIHRRVVDVVGEADLFVSTLESPLGARPLDPDARYLNRFHMSDLYFDGVLTQLERSPASTAFSVAANHAGDHGTGGFADTISALEKRGLLTIGRYDPGKPQVTTYDAKGLRLGLVGWTHWMQPGEPFDDHEPEITRSAHVRAADWHSIRSRESIDALVGLPHWGYEFRRFPEEETRRFAKELIESHGFRFVAGSHPHIIQPVEWFQGGICAYSLANFIFTQGDYCGFGGSKSLLLNPLLQIDLVASTDERRGQIAGYRIVPLFQSHEQKRIRIVPLDEAPGEMQRLFERQLGKMFT